MADAVEIKIPSLGESITEGVIATWAKSDGEHVEADETLIELETDKAVMEIPSEASGKLEILAQAGETVEVDQLVAKVHPGEAGTQPESSADEAEGDSKDEAKEPVQANGAETEAAKQPAADGEPRLSPAVRKLVREHDLDPEQIPGTGKGGRLTKADVLDYLAKPESDEQKAESKPSAEAAPQAPVSDEEVRREPMSRIRQRIAQRLVEAQQNAAILTTFNDVDMSAVMALRKKYKDAFEQKHGVKLGFMSLFGRAVIQALHEIPQLNAQIEGSDIVYYKHVHLGIAVSTERGLMVPVVRYADRMSVPELERAIGALAAKGRDGKITPDDLSGGTFSISNGGIFGSLLSTPILNPPQSGILGMHRIEERPVAIDGQVEIRPMMYLAVSYDHRLVGGREAVTFLKHVKEFLEDPQRLLLEM